MQGLVRGSMIQSKHIGKDMAAGLKTLVGGELKGYTEMMEESRDCDTAHDRAGQGAGSRRGCVCAVYLQLCYAGRGGGNGLRNRHQI